MHIFIIFLFNFCKIAMCLSVSAIFSINGSMERSPSTSYISILQPMYEILHKIVYFCVIEGQDRLVYDLMIYYDKSFCQLTTKESNHNWHLSFFLSFFLTFYQCKPFWYKDRNNHSEFRDMFPSSPNWLRDLLKYSNFIPNLLRLFLLRWFSGISNVISYQVVILSESTCFY